MNVRRPLVPVCLAASMLGGCAAETAVMTVTVDPVVTISDRLPTTVAPIETTSPPTTNPSTTSPTTTNPTTTTSSTSSTTSTTEPAQPLTILLTNDDGISAPGIGELERHLRDLDGVDVVVVAPADDQSGSSDTTSVGEVTAQAALTSSGADGTSVNGTPADAVVYALDVLGVEPDLVIAGANRGQNIASFVPHSGTVGAARVAARRGLPAIAVSAGFAQETDFATAASLAVSEVEAFIADGPTVNVDHTVVNLNAPSCAAGTSVRGVIDVEVAAAFPPDVRPRRLEFDCSSSRDPPADDVTAILTGFATRSIVPADI